MFRACVAALAALCAVFLFSVTTALADDWLVTKLRGTVLQLVDNDWQPLGRGDVVSDDRVLRTLRNGRAELQRGREVISLGPDTQIQIHDKDGKQFTTVQEYFGTVEVDAEARNVQHFAVQTPFLAAVVKGTHFIVTSDKRGSSVEVARGHVEVKNAATGARTPLAVGQEASVGADGSFSVDGAGTLPQIVDKTGKVVSASDGKVVGVTVAVPGKDLGKGVGVGVGVKVGQGGTPPGATVRTEVGAGENGVGVGASVDTGPVSVDVGVNVGGGSNNGEGGLLGLKVGLGRGR